jgi:membrane protein YqaA with SNARE-associated domain
MGSGSGQPHVDTAGIQTGGDVMGKVVTFIGATLGGAVGWWLGEGVGVMTAFLLSVLGTAAGIYAARRWLSEYLP